MPTVQQILSEPRREWVGASPASELEIRSLEKAVGTPLPCEYRDFLCVCNGGEGPLAISPFWFQLFDVNFTLSLVRDDFYRKQFPGLFFFGSNGGLESIAFDMRGRSPWPIVAIDCIAGLDSLLVISETFGDFIDAIGRGSTDDVQRKGV